MSSDNASSAVTYTSISSDSNGLSWGIPLVNVVELPEMDPYKEVAQQGQTPPLSPAYIPDPMELDEHALVYIMEPEHPEYHVLIDDDIQIELWMTMGSRALVMMIDDDDADMDNEDEEPTEDKEEEEQHLAPAVSFVVPVVDPVPSAGDTKAFKTDESAPTPRSPQTRVPFSRTRLRRARKTVRLEPPMIGSMEGQALLRLLQHHITTTALPMIRHH
ncbi:hypothetical protein Tco_0598482 [Tanacetum coccineum]